MELSAAGTTDPEGDTLFYRWWQYLEADSADTEVKITNADAEKTSFTAPDEVGRKVHIILEVTDSGTPALTRYQRVVCTIQ